MSDNKIYCKNCKYYKFIKSETIVSPNFVDPTPPTNIPTCVGDYHYYWGSSMCTHDICFVKITEEKPEKSYVHVERINGQGQLNWNNSCKLYKPNWFTILKDWFNKL